MPENVTFAMLDKEDLDEFSDYLNDEALSLSKRPETVFYGAFSEDWVLRKTRFWSLFISARMRTDLCGISSASCRARPPYTERWSSLRRTRTDMRSR